MPLPRGILALHEQYWLAMQRDDEFKKTIENRALNLGGLHHGFWYFKITKGSLDPKRQDEGLDGIVCLIHAYEEVGDPPTDDDKRHGWMETAPETKKPPTKKTPTKKGRPKTETPKKVTRRKKVKHWRFHIIHVFNPPVPAVIGAGFSGVLKNDYDKLQLYHMMNAPTRVAVPHPPLFGLVVDTEMNIEMDTSIERSSVEVKAGTHRRPIGVACANIILDRIMAICPRLWDELELIYDNETAWISQTRISTNGKILELIVVPWYHQWANGDVTIKLIIGLYEYEANDTLSVIPHSMFIHNHFSFPASVDNTYMCNHSYE